MDFNLTNGTISSLTITTDKNIDSATVTGADYTINDNTITLTNLTASLVLELTGESSSAINKIYAGTLNTKNFYVGTLSVEKIYLGQYLVYAKGAPTEGYFKLSDGKWLYTSDGKAFKAIEQTGHTVTINFTNGLSTSQWRSTTLYDNYTVTSYDVYLSSADEIGFISSANGSAIVTTSTGKLFIFGQNTGYRETEAAGSVTVSNGIEVVETYSYSTQGEPGILQDIGHVYIDGVSASLADYVLLYVFNVNADGTITIQAADWDNAN